MLVDGLVAALPGWVEQCVSRVAEAWSEPARRMYMRVHGSFWLISVSFCSETTTLMYRSSS